MSELVKTIPKSLHKINHTSIPAQRPDLDQLKETFCHRATNNRAIALHNVPLCSNGGGASAPICFAIGSTAGGIAQRGGETPFYRYLACGAMPALRAVPSRFSFKSCNDFTILAMITLYSGLEMWIREINVTGTYQMCLPNCSATFSNL